MTKLLVIDKDRVTVEMLTNWLKVYGYKMHHAFTGKQAKSVWLAEKPDIVILDIALDDVDALSMCQELKYKHDALVLVLTSGKDVEDEVRCLQAGVDDYLRKPFYPGQLLARIRALTYRARPTLKQRPSSVITIGPIRMNFLRNEVSVDGKTRSLTPTESRLLYHLATNADVACPTDEIVSHVWDHVYTFTDDRDLLKPHIRHLREKIEPKPSEPRYIVTVPGVGYVLTTST